MEVLDVVRSLLGEESGGGVSDQILMANAMFVTLSILVFLSVVFELTKAKITHMATENTKPIVENLWMELTVLGFLSLLSFLAVKSGILDSLSVMIFGEEGELAEIVETVHMMLFLVMVIFMTEVLLLLRLGNQHEKQWTDAEKVAQLHDDHDECAAGTYLTRIYEHGNPQSCLPEFMQKIWPFNIASTPVMDARMDFEYHLLRKNFVVPGEASINKPLIDDFNFAHYLSIRLGETLGEVVELPPIVWVILECCFAIFWMSARMDIEELITCFVFLGYILMAGMAIISFKVDSIYYSLLPYIPKDKSELHHHIAARDRKKAKADARKHYLENLRHPHNNNEMKLSPKASINSEPINDHVSEHSPLIDNWDVPMYLRHKHHSHHNPHYELFWGGHHGHHYLLHAVRVLHILLSIYIALLGVYFASMVYQPRKSSETHLTDTIIYVISCIIPVCVILLGFTPHFMTRLTVVTSVEAMRDKKVIARVLRHMSTAKALKIVGLINMMKKWDRLRQIASSKDKTFVKNMEPLDEIQRKRFEDAFNLFDTDNSGTIDKKELETLLGTMGVDTESCSDIMSLLDIDGDGILTLDEFVTNMGIYMADADQDPDTQIDSMFQMFDEDGSGTITTDEFRATLMKLNVGNVLTSNDIEELIHEIDKDNDRAINLDEFKMLIKSHLGQL